MPTLDFSLHGEIGAVCFRHTLLWDVLDADDASNAYVHLSDCLVDAVQRQHGGAPTQCGKRVSRVSVYGVDEDFLETWHEQENANMNIEPADIVKILFGAYKGTVR